ncbi:MAG: hypothetical protein JWR81_2338 [Pseudonocardia sp.]|jgi:hypothetical protein|nr:hypothetical protein [Pseudonocardia sp.]MDT7616491.1 hypothetical protein [Pseudonocardiales bacterium]
MPSAAYAVIAVSAHSVCLLTGDPGLRAPGMAAGIGRPPGA